MAVKEKQMAQRASVPRPYAWAGIDPGKTGGAAIFVGDKLRWAEPLEFDTPGLLYDTLNKYEVTDIILERAQGAAGQANQFEYGRSFGRTESACLLTGARVHYVAPAWWKARLAVPADKETAYLKACRLFPVLEFLAPPGNRGGLQAVHGMAEAALIGSLALSDNLWDVLQTNNAARIAKAGRRKPRFNWKGD